MIANVTKFSKIIGLIVLILIQISTYAQNFKSNLNIGFNASQVDGDQYGGYNKPGLFLGFDFGLELKNNNMVYYLINYNQKGSRKKTNPQNLDIFKLNINYIGNQFILQKNNIIKSLPKISLLIGLGLNIKINSKVDYGLGWQYTELNKQELSIISGIKFPIYKSISLKIVHESSLLRMGNPQNNQNYILSRNGLYNRQVTFAFLIPLKK